MTEKVPTWHGIPSLMSFEVTSMEQEDIQEFLGELRSLIRDNGLILVNEAKL